MAAGGYKEFVAGETLDENEINDYLMQGILVFGGTAARGSAIPSPVEGQFTFRTDEDLLEFYDGSSWVEVTSVQDFDFLVIAGGGGGGSTGGDARSGGGAGGYRTSAGTSGGGASAEETLSLAPGSYRVTVGAGGAIETQGTQSWFASIQCVGGGRGVFVINNFGGDENGFIGGSGAGGAGWDNTAPGGAGISEQGFAGGTASGSTDHGAGGGGAGAAGGLGSGGAGVTSTITGTSVERAGGGLGSDGGTVSGGGGTGGVAGTANTGGGGGHGAAGGSGVVIIKYPDSITLTIGAGLSSSTSSAGGFKVTTFTAGTDTVSF